MDEEHPNIAILKRFDPGDLAGTADVFAEDAVFHFFNPQLPDLEGDYVGRERIGAFFDGMAARTHGTFRVCPVAVRAVGDELLVSQTRNSMTMDGKHIEVDVVLVWRIVAGRITEIWDIPAVHTARVSDA